MQPFLFMSAQINPLSQQNQKSKKHKRYFQTQLVSTVHEKCLTKWQFLIDKCKFECIIPNGK